MFNRTVNTPVSNSIIRVWWEYILSIFSNLNFSVEISIIKNCDDLLFRIRSNLSRYNISFYLKYYCNFFQHLWKISNILSANEEGKNFYSEVPLPNLIECLFRLSGRKLFSRVLMIVVAEYHLANVYK